MTTESSPSEKKNFWQRFIAPHPSISDPVEERFAKLLAVLLLILVPLYFLPEGIRAILERHSLRENIYWSSGVLILGAAYLLARSPYPRWGSRLTLLYFSLLPFLALVIHGSHYQDEDVSGSLIWTLPVLLMALILLSPEHIKHVVLFNIALYLVIPALWSRLEYSQVASVLWIVIAAGGLLLISASVQSSYLKNLEKEAHESEMSALRYREIFLDSPIALWEMDFSLIKKRLDEIAEKHSGDMMTYILENPEAMKGAATGVVLLDANSAALELYETDNLETLKKSLHIISNPHSMLALRDGVIGLWQGLRNNPIETVHNTLAGNKRNVIIRFSLRSGYEDTWERVITSVADVTERRAAESSMRQLASAVEASASSVVITNLEGKIEYVNPAFSRVTGYTREDAMGENPRVLKSGQHPPEFYQEMWGLLTKGETWQGEIVNKKKNGEIFWEHATISPVKNELGEIVSYVAVKDDITAMKRSEADLRKLSNASEQIASAIVITDIKGVIEYVNPAFTKITGYSREEAIGQTPSLLKSGRHALEFYADLWETVARGEIWRGELINRRKDGEIYWESQVISPVRNDVGEITHFVAVKDDITKIKQSERELRNLSNAAGQIASAIVIANLEGIVEYVNPAFFVITGYTKEEVLGKRLDMLRSGEHDDEFYARHSEIISRGEIWRGEMINRRKDGTLYWEYQVVSPVKNEMGEVEHYVSVKDDITRRKELEQALAVAHEEALVASDMKTQLLANVSHDMRTPLGAILGYTEMLQTGVFQPLNEEQANATRAIAASSQRLLDFVSDLLNQAQIDTGEIVLNPSHFKPQQLFDTLGGEISLARTQNLMVETHIDEDMPEEIIGDRYWLGQILHNLLSNAIKFTPQGGKIEISLLKSGEYAWALRVADNGKGIPQDAQNYIFESFRQVDGSPSRQAHTGSGLGLSIVHHLVRLMKGEIRLESEVGKGSTFTILLPLQEDEEKNA